MSPPDTPTDADLVNRTLGGSEDAFREIVTRYRRPLFGLIVRMVQESSLAEDLSQETFVKAYRALHSFDPRHKFSSWLFKIAHNATIDHLRKGRISAESMDADTGTGTDLSQTLADPRAESPEESAERRDLAQVIERCIGMLRPEYREVLVLRHREGMSYQEIVEVTGMALGTTKTNLHRARKRLAELLAQEGFAPDNWAG